MNLEKELIKDPPKKCFICDNIVDNTINNNKKILCIDMGSSFPSRFLYFHKTCLSKQK